MLVDNKVKISSSCNILTTRPNFEWDEITEEPMFFNCDMKFAYENGGPITKDFIEAAPVDFWGGTFDSRVHMLKKGFSPCIPGWHLDSIPRTKPNNQPNLEERGYSEHVMAIYGDNVAATEFLMADVEFASEIYNSEHVYQDLDSVVAHWYKNWDITIARAMPGELIYFNQDSIHRGVPAVGDGWRWFGRASLDSRNGKETNKIRKQTQVYLPVYNQGW